jgi:hypothetical protein
LIFKGGLNVKKGELGCELCRDAIKKAEVETFLRPVIVCGNCGFEMSSDGLIISYGKSERWGSNEI